MTKNDSAPTMIIPSGAEIQVDAHGQLSVRTPGNLVIQNSGHYGEIESVNGSIRIEANAEVEAVSVRCARTCYVQGSLTSWKVKAQSVHLEESAQARIVLQETESIEIGKNAKMVGNFSSEKELFLLFSRFAQQLRSLPFYFDRQSDAALETPQAGGKKEALPAAGVLPIPEALPVPEALPAPEALPVSAALPVSRAEPVSKGRSAAMDVDLQPLPSKVLEAGKELPDNLFFALVLLQREAQKEAYGSTSVRVLEELVKLLRERDLETLLHTYRILFGRIVEPGEDVIRAMDLIAKSFGNSGTEAGPNP